MSVVSRAFFPIAFLMACQPGPVVVSATPNSGGPVGVTAASEPVLGWRFTAREHVDLWLHGFAYLQPDSSLVPAYRLAYRAEALRARGSSSTGLLAREAVLASGLRRNPTLPNAAFVALYFATWDDLVRGCRQFLRAGGNVQLANNAETLRMFATLATYFPSAVERDWLRTYLDALTLEREQWFRGWWQSEQAARASTRSALESLWRGGRAEAFARFLRGTNQRTGTVVLTLALGGEGRAIDVGQRDNFAAVPFPASAPDEALFVLAHEVIGVVSNAVVRDHTTPNDQQSGEAGRLSTLAAVRGGAMLLERVAPDLVDGYRRYYLTTGRQTPGPDVARQFATIFPLPEALLSAMNRQIDLVLSGI